MRARYAKQVEAVEKLPPNASALCALCLWSWRSVLFVKHFKTKRVITSPFDQYYRISLLHCVVRVV